MHDVKPGQLIDDSQQRDAIHIAVAPVVAADGEKLYPCQDIGFVGGTTHVGANGEHIGIVDPFLKKPVYQGDRFWMLVYPQTITSLRHDWVHPAFEQEKIPLVTTKAESETWLRNFCDTNDCPEYETVIDAAANGQTWPFHKDYLHFDGRDAHGEIPDEFWVHVENVIGRKCEVKPKYFSCSC